MTLSPRRRRPLKPGQYAPRQDTEAVTSEQLRALFREARVMERVAAGELQERILRSRSPDPLYNLPEGTKSELVAYLNKDGKTIAEIHRFVLPDGKLGASGKPDPKAVFHKGILYFLRL